MALLPMEGGKFIIDKQLSRCSCNGYDHKARFPRVPPPPWHLWRPRHVFARRNLAPLSFRELYDAIDTLEWLFKRYCLLLRAEEVRLLPVPQYDWKAIFKAIFKVPWIKANG